MSEAKSSAYFIFHLKWFIRDEYCYSTLKRRSFFSLLFVDILVFFVYEYLCAWAHILTFHRARFSFSHCQRHMGFNLSKCYFGLNTISIIIAAAIKETSTNLTHDFHICALSISIFLEWLACRHPTRFALPVARTLSLFYPL